MKQICAECSSETLCPNCDHKKLNLPIIVKYFDQVMPIIVFTCKNCHVELFRAMTHESKTFHVNYCLACASIIEAGNNIYQMNLNK